MVKRLEDSYDNPQSHYVRHPPRGRGPALGRPGGRTDMLTIKELVAGYGKVQVLSLIHI